MPTTLRKVSCWPANDASGRSSAVAEERTAKVASGLSAARRSNSLRIAASSAGGNGCCLDPAADLGAGLGQGAHVVGVERASRSAIRLARPPSARNWRKACAVVAKPPGTRTPELAQLADHFAEGGVLAADRLDIGHSQMFETGDEGGRQVGG